MSDIPAPTAMREIGPIDRARFDAEVRPLAEPVVLRGQVADWPAVAQGRVSSAAIISYLKEFATTGETRVIGMPPGRGGRFFYNEDLSGFNFTQGRMTLTRFLDQLLIEETNPDPPALAAQSIVIPEILPGFERANVLPLLDTKVAPRIWIGSRSRVAAHYDLMENVGCVVAGRRRFTLFPPAQLPNLYVGPFELTPAGTPVSMVDVAEPELERFPLYAEALKTALSATLEPGDAIYIPYHWWHAVESLEPVSMFVNYWWNPAPAGVGNPYDALLHGIYALKNLPPDQRAAWRTNFDHYVFGANGDPVPHLPEPARGLFGASTPRQLERIRQTLKHRL